MKKTLSRREMLKVLAIGAASAAVAACTSKATTQAPTNTAAVSQPTTAVTVPTAQATATAAATTAAIKKGGTLNWARLGDFTSWNIWATNSSNDIISDIVYSRMLWKDSQGNMNPDLAESWTMANDGLSLTLNLRKGVTWHDGKPFTANDYVTMYQYTKDSTLNTATGVAKIGGLLKSFSDVVAPDDSTLVIKFPQPLPYVYDILDYWYALLITDKTDPNMTKGLPVGTGPFKMTDWKPSQYAKIEKFSSYYDSTLPYLDGIVINSLSQAETLVPNLLSGTMDGAGYISSSDVGTIKANPAYSVYINEGSGNIVNVIVNTKLAPLDKKEVRQALSYALNRQSIADNVYYGLSQPITSPFYSPASIAYRKDLVMAHQFDLQKATSLLKQAGVGNFTLKFVTDSQYPEWKTYAQVWQADLAKIGITLMIDEFEAAKFYDIAQTHASDMEGYNLAAWGTGRVKRDPAIFFQTQPQYAAGPKSGLTNPYGWYDADYENVVTQGSTEQDPAKRQALYQQANQIIVDEVPMIQVVTDPSEAGLSNVMQGLFADLLGFYHFEKVWLNR